MIVIEDEHHGFAVYAGATGYALVDTRMDFIVDVFRTRRAAVIAYDFACAQVARDFARGHIT